MKLSQFKLEMEITTNELNRYTVKVIGKKYIWVKSSTSIGLIRIPECVYSKWTI